MFFFLQYSDSNQARSVFVPLLVLHAPQHLTTFVGERKSLLLMCSQVALFLGTPLVRGYSFILLWQYTQSLSRFLILRSRSGAIFHLFIWVLWPKEIVEKKEVSIPRWRFQDRILYGQGLLHVEGFENTSDNWEMF